MEKIRMALAAAVWALACAGCGRDAWTPMASRLIGCRRAIRRRSVTSRPSKARATICSAGSAWCANTDRRRELPIGIRVRRSAPQVDPLGERVRLEALRGVDRWGSSPCER